MIDTNLSDKIRSCRDGAVNNPYQGTDKKVLFVCSMGILRSATGSRLYGDKYNTRSAGTDLVNGLIPVTQRLFDWADEIVFVNDYNYQKSNTNFKIDNSKIKVLDIPDAYEHMHPELVKAFNDQYEPIEIK